MIIHSINNNTIFCFSCSKKEPPKKQEKNELLKQIEKLQKEINEKNNNQKKMNC